MIVGLMKYGLLVLATGFVATSLEAKPVGKASFLATTSGGFDVKGEGAPVESLDAVTYVVTLKDFKTGMDLRDTHMCDALACAKFPKATLKMPAAVTKDGSFTGTMELHGVSKPITGTAAFKGAAATVKFSIKGSDFGLTFPDYKLVKVNDLVEVTVELAP